MKRNINSVLLVLIVLFFLWIIVGFIDRDKNLKLKAKIKAAIRDTATIYGDSRDLALNDALNPNYHTSVTYTAQDL